MRFTILLFTIYYLRKKYNCMSTLRFTILLFTIYYLRKKTACALLDLLLYYLLFYYLQFTI